MNNIPVLELLMKILIRQYFQPSNGVILISSSSFNMPLGTPIINININDNFSVTSKVLSNNFGCQNFILNIHHPTDTFQNIEKKLHHSRSRFNNRKYIVLTNSSRKVSEIFDSKAAGFVSNLLVVCMEEIHQINLPLYPENYEIVFNFWTHRYSEMTKGNEHYLLDKWFSRNSSFLKNANLFPNKLENLHGRKIKVGTFDYAPYVVMDNATRPVILGTELKIVSTFLEYVNGTLELVNQKDLWGDVFDNGSSYGLRGNLIEDKLDIGAAAIFLSAKAHKYFDYSDTYMRIELTCLVPVPRLAAVWLSPWYSFKEYTWLILVLTYTFIAITVFWMNYFEAYIKQDSNLSKKVPIIQNTIASVAKPMLSQTISKNQFYAKPFLALVLLSTMIITTAYNSGLASIMTKPIYERSIDTMDDFLNSDIPWGGLQVADWIVAWKNGEKGKHRRVGERYIPASEQELRQFSLTGNFAFKIERIYNQYHIDSYLEEDIVHKYRPMKDSLGIQNCVLIFRRNSVLVPEINKIISRMIQSGLVLYWTQEGANYKKSAFQRQLSLARMNSQRSEVVVLKLNHVSGLFCLWLMGNFTALIVFCLEISCKKYNSLKMATLY